MQVIDVHKANLVKLGYSSLEAWVAASPKHVYIGRVNPYVAGATKNKWGNPFSVEKYGRDECLRMYEAHIRASPSLMTALKELDGCVCGCWCLHPGATATDGSVGHPEPCHGHILQKLIKEVSDKATKSTK